MRISESKQKRNYSLLVISITVCLLATPWVASAQDTPREVRSKAMTALSQGAYADAVGYLQQLVEWYGSSKKDTTLSEMEMVYFTLGTAHFFLGQFPEAREAFTTYTQKYRSGVKTQDASVYIADCFRFEERYGDALRAYNLALKKFPIQGDLKADVYTSIARCYLAQDKWDKAIPILRKLYEIAPDFTRRNWAASLMTTAFLKEMELEKVYRLVPYLLTPNSFAGRNVAFNMAAIEAGDNLFADEKYRDALWVYRLVYPHDVLLARSQQYLESLQKKADRLKRSTENPRDLMRVQESIGELESEIKALGTIENYDTELFFRMARSYMEIRRYREARDLFIYLADSVPEPRANEALFLAFQCAARIVPQEQAIELGLRFMEKYPAKEYYDDVSIMVGQMYSKQEDWPHVISLLTKALEISPRHTQGAECMFLIGYASFMEEKFEECASWLKKMNVTFPGNPREPDGTYWIGMSEMFMQKFEAAIVEFDMILNTFKDSPYVVDAKFRRAVCDFGLSRLPEAEKQFDEFVTLYPTNPLCGEGYMMLGDTAAARADLPRAVDCYLQVPRYEVNIEFYNYSAFKAGEILCELRKFPECIAHFKSYIKQNREGCNIPQAIYWIGTAMRNAGEQRGVLEFFRDAVARYGTDRKALGIDLIIEEWIGQGKTADKTVSGYAWKQMEDLCQQAEKDHQSSLVLRLKRAMLYKPGITEEEKNALMQQLIQAANLTNASSGVLELILDEAQKRQDSALAIATAQIIIKDFTETDTALSARMVLAKYAIEDKNYKTAIKHLNIVKEVYATAPEAGQALQLLGDLYIKMSKFTEADECFKSITAVKEWKGLWPPALFGRGECARLQRNLEQACAYYERIYVMYSKFTQWSAKAYLARAECLTRMQLYTKAIETLQEMVANPDYKALPEFTEAEQRLASLLKR
ncbi:MAG: tetratricopeptide repeat protein [bacterium]